jgi:hypothetical protein
MNGEIVNWAIGINWAIVGVAVSIIGLIMFILKWLYDHRQNKKKARAELEELKRRNDIVKSMKPITYQYPEIPTSVCNPTAIDDYLARQPTPEQLSKAMDCMKPESIDSALKNAAKAIEDMKIKHFGHKIEKSDIP